MHLGLLLLVSLLAFTEKVNTTPGIKHEKEIKKELSGSIIPLVKHGTQLQREASGTDMLGIIGGDTTDISAHPYQLAIDNSKSFVCSGALLNRIWAIALASCTAGAQPSDLTVRMGSDTNVHGGTVLNVTEIVIHPNYDYSKTDNDFALLKLNTYICFDNTSTSIKFTEKKPQKEVKGVISGWGSVRGTGAAYTKFRQLEMRVVSHSACQKHYSVTGDTITNSMFCATAGDKGPCYNDFGDPLVVNNTLYGLYSWSRGCANPNYPAVFSNLATVKDWLYNVMNDACTCGIY